jgi:hypothetical protein
MNIKDIKLGGDKSPNRVLYMLRSDLSDTLFLTVYAGMASATAKNVGGRPNSSIHQLYTRVQVSAATNPKLTCIGCKTEVKNLR